MPQFFIKSSNINDKIIVSEDKSDIKHITDVLRSKVDDEIIFIDENEILYTAKILEFSKNTLKAEILHSENPSEP